MIPSPAIRWVLYAAALALMLVGVRTAERPEERAAAARAQFDPAPRLTTASTSDASGVPSLQLERLALRSQPETAGDPFIARSWEALAGEEARRNALPPPPPPPPQAPPLPFTFMGKLIDDDRVVVFLTNGVRNWVVRAGDTIDDAYRVEAIGDERMTLTYLALQIPQELAIGERTPRPDARSTGSTAEALPAPDAVQASAPLPGQIPLLFAAPSRVAAGNELVVSIGLRPRGGARAARVELAYDAKVLAAVDAPARDTGRVTVDMVGGAAPPARVRFRVIAPAPTTTRIGIESATATDARGASLPLATPGVHKVAIVPAGE